MIDSGWTDGQPASLGASGEAPSFAKVAPPSLLGLLDEDPPQPDATNAETSAISAGERRDDDV